MLDGVPDQTEQLEAVAELRTLDATGLHPEAALAAATRTARVPSRAATCPRSSTTSKRLPAGPRPRVDPMTGCGRRGHERRSRSSAIGWTMPSSSPATLRPARTAGHLGAYETYGLHMVLVWREQNRLTELEPAIEPLLAQSVHPGASKLRGMFALARLALSRRSPASSTPIPSPGRGTSRGWPTCASPASSRPPPDCRVAPLDERSFHFEGRAPDGRDVRLPRRGRPLPRPAC